MATLSFLRASCSVALVLWSVVTGSVAARAGEFFERDGAAVWGHDVVAYFTEGKPVKGMRAHKAEYQGSTFLFSSAANRAAFVADPGKYAPQYNGFCAYGVSGGYKAAIDPAAFTVTDGKLYLNYSRGVQRQWSADIPGFVSKADQNWPTVRSQTRIVQ